MYFIKRSHCYDPINTDKLTGAYTMFAIGLTYL